MLATLPLSPASGIYLGHDLPEKARAGASGLVLVTESSSTRAEGAIFGLVLQNGFGLATNCPILQLLLCAVLACAGGEKDAESAAEERTSILPCADELERLRAQLSRADRCSQDHECRLVYLPCPFTCVRPVNAAYIDLPRFGREATAYKQRCNMCVYRCRTPTLPPRCINHACVQEWAPLVP